MTRPKGKRMVLRMVARAAMVRRGRALTAMLAVAIAAAVATAMLNLYVDVQAKLRKEFRSYGANLVVAAKEGEALPADVMARVDAVLGGAALAAPFGYAVAETSDGSPVVVAGTDFARVERLNRWWSVTAWPHETHTALLGVRAAAAFSPKGEPFELAYEGKKVEVQPAGIVRTGAAEDSRVYLSLADFQALTGAGVQSVEVAASGSAEDIARTQARLQEALPGAEVRPVRQIMEAEARVLGKTRAALLAAIALIIVTAGLCVLATLTAWVLDRRKDFAVMKALGASQRTINGLFAAEAAALGAAGAVVGFVIGIGVAAWIGRVNFHAAVVPRWGVLPQVVAGSIAVALLSAALPISLLRRVQPATLLKGE